jgi:RNA polymerase sporulation-specific sigma factor
MFASKEKNSIFFINSYDILPPPLSKDDEAFYIRMLDYDRAHAKRKLIEHNLRLVVYIARKFESNMSVLEDLISIGTIGLIKAVNTYRSDKKIKLATYASKCIENEILMHLRKTNRLKLEISLDEPLNMDREGNELLLSDIVCEPDESVSSDIEKESEHIVLLQAIGNLNALERDIINMRFGVNGTDKKTQKEVAETLSISQSYISRLEKKIVGNLRKDMLKLMQ